jgi:hypothetical protein
MDGRLIEIEPPVGQGSVFISVLRRNAERKPAEGEGVDLLSRLPVWRNKVSWTEPEESLRDHALVTLAECVGPEGHDWTLGVLVGLRRAVVFTFDSVTGEDQTAHDQARQIFLTLRGLDRADTITKSEPPSLSELVVSINATAREILQESGEHALTAFVVSSAGDVQPRLLDARNRDEVPVALARLADAVAREGAVAVAVAGEAWAAPADAIPEGGVAESLHARDLLLVAAVDSGGNEITLATPVIRRGDQAVDLGETRTSTERLAALDPVRRVWGLLPDA